MNLKPNMKLTHEESKEHKMDSTPTPIKESSFKTSQAQETTKLNFKGESSHNTPLTTKYLEGNKGTKSTVIRNIT